MTIIVPSPLADPHELVESASGLSDTSPFGDPSGNKAERQRPETEVKRVRNISIE